MSSKNTKDKKSEDNFCLNPQIQFGTFMFSLLGTTIANHIYHYIKSQEAET